MRATAIAAALALAAAAPVAGPAAAQDEARPGVFASYEAYESAVLERALAEDLLPLVRRIGGAQGLSQDQVEALRNTLAETFPEAFTRAAVLKRQNLGNGFRQEARVFWNENGAYGYYYALTHETDERTRLLRYRLETVPEAVLVQF